MRKIIVDPAMLEITASRIENLAQEFNHNVALLYDAIDKLSASWSGKDNIAFTQQIYGFSDDFKKIYTTSIQYSNYLKASSFAYRDTMNELINQARNLVN